MRDIRVLYNVYNYKHRLNAMDCVTEMVLFFGQLCPTIIVFISGTADFVWVMRV